MAVYRKASEDLNDVIMRNVASVYLQPRSRHDIDPLVGILIRKRTAEPGSCSGQQCIDLPSAGPELPMS